MRVLGLDLGAKRIGLALSDEDAKFAFPAGVLERRGRKLDVAALRELIAEQAVDRIVMGLPIHMDGRQGPEAEATRDFARALEVATNLRVELQDERWTTLEAQRALRESGPARRRHKRRKGEVDAAAASIILRAYLDRRNASGGDEGHGS